MEYLPELRVLRPATLDEAVALQGEHPGARWLAGGTDIVVNIRRGIVEAPVLIDLNRIDEIGGIEANRDGGLTVGAGVTLAALEADPRIGEHYAAVAEAAAQVAAATHREVATVGGNLCLDTRCVFYNQSEWWRASNDYCLKYRGDICHVAPKGDHCFAAFSGDLAPAMMVFAAEAEVAGPNGRRRLPLSELYADDGAAHLLLAEGEVLVAVRLPEPAGWLSGYAKARVRGAIDFPLAGVAVALKRVGRDLSDLRVALTGTNSRPIVLAGTDALLGGPIDDDAADRLAGLLPKQIKPMTSTFTPPGYRRRVVTNLTRRLARELFDRA